MRYPKRERVSLRMMAKGLEEGRGTGVELSELVISFSSSPSSSFSISGLVFENEDDDEDEHEARPDLNPTAAGLRGEGGVEWGGDATSSSIKFKASSMGSR